MKGAMKQHFLTLKASTRMCSNRTTGHGTHEIPDKEYPEILKILLFTCWVKQMSDLTKHPNIKTV